MYYCKASQDFRVPMLKVIFVISLLLYIFPDSVSAQKTIVYREKKKDRDSLIIHEGFVSLTAQRLKYKRENKIKAIIDLTEPVVIAQSEGNEPWGYFQFPCISKTKEGYLIVTWQMKADTHLEYGRESLRCYSPLISKDEGLTWEIIDKEYYSYHLGYNVQLHNGNILQVTNPISKDIRSYLSFPPSIAQIDNFTFYYLDSLPGDLKGVYFNLQTENGKTQYLHSDLEDPGLLRYAIDSLMPVVWWGNIKQLGETSLIAGVYPSYYLSKEGQILPGGVSFCRSDDLGHSWRRIGNILQLDGIIGHKYDPQRVNEGFSESAFEVLNDSSFICIMRTGSASPMYQSFSNDLGYSWSKPTPISPNGVKPSLLLLKNGVLVLASGRPGIQIRFSFDGTGHHWSDPIDMIPYMNNNGDYDLYATCGYPSIIGADDNSFYIVYSNFLNKNEAGEQVKEILFRRVIVNKD